LPLKTTSASPGIEPLSRVTSLWLEPSSAIRAKAIEALQVSTGYSPSIINSAIQNVFEELTRDKLIAYVQAEKIQFRSKRDATVLHIGAGNVFTSWLHGAVMTLLMGYRCWIKPSVQEPVFARLWQQSVQVIDFELAGQISIVSWNDDLLRQVNAVVAYGSDETLSVLRSKTAATTLFVGFGHKLSIAIALNESTQIDQFKTWRARAVQDCELFDLNGCLSPQVLYVEGADPGPWKSLLEGVKHAPEIRPFTSLATIVSDLAPFKDHLSAIGVAGPMSRLDAIRPQLEQLGTTRICELGQMQRPPLTWRNGGISLAEALAPLM